MYSLWPPRALNEFAEIENAGLQRKKEEGLSRGLWTSSRGARPVRSSSKPSLSLILVAPGQCMRAREREV